MAYGLTKAVTSVITYSDIFTFFPAGNEIVVHRKKIFSIQVHNKMFFVFVMSGCCCI